MTAIAAIAVPDAAGTPVTKTFTENKVDGDTARWNEKTSAYPAGFLQLAMSLRDPIAGNGASTYKQTVEFNFPVITTYTDAGGVTQPNVARIYRAKVELLIPVNGTLQERKDFRKLLFGTTGIMSDAQAKAMVEDLNHIT